jgi:hypothetical protein
MVRARRGKVPARGADWDEVPVTVEVAWAVRFRPGRAGFAYVRDAGTKRPTSPGNLAFRELVPSAADR